MSNTTPPPAAPPKRSHTNAIIIGTAAVLIAGIVTAGIVVSNSGDDGEPTPTVAKAASTPTASSAKPSPSPSRETLKIGDTVDISAADADFSAAALSYTDKGVKGVPEMLSDGQRWAVAMVKVCNKGSDVIGVTPFPWSLAYADGARVEAAGMNAGELPQPLYPMDAKIKGGDCVRGNIVFQVPAEGRAERVLYSPGDLDEPVEWQIGK